MRITITAFFLLTTIFSFGQVVKNQEWEFTNNVTIDGTLKLTDAPTNGYVLTTDGSGNASWQSSGSGVVYSASTTISSAQLLAIHTTPITLVAAQGANTIVIPLRITYYMDYNTTTYAGDIVTKAVLDPSGVNANFGNNSIIGLTSDGIISITGTTLNSSGSISTLFNTPLVLTTATSNPTTGNSPLKVTVTYIIITI